MMQSLTLSSQSFVGMMSEIHMWDYILSPWEIQSYIIELNFTAGNTLNWSAVECTGVPYIWYGTIFFVKG